MEATENSVAKPQVKSGQGGKRKDVHAWRHCFLVLSLIVVASFAVRVEALRFWGTGAIESEGAEYARIAENLRKGVGYVGIATPGRELMFPPLFPLLISGASLITGNYVRAGRLVSLVMGGLLPLPVFGTASRLFNRRTAFVAATLMVLYPLLVNLSFTVLSEGPYTTLLLSAVYVVLRALDRPSIRMWCGVGGALGLAYLVRQEAAAPLLIAVLFALTATDGHLAIRCKRAIAAVMVFAALALPEVVFIYRSTGKVRLEGKSAIFFALSTRILARQTSLEADHQLPEAVHEEAANWAGDAINANLQGTGVWMRPNAEVIRETRMTLKELSHILKRSTRQNAPVLLQQLSSKWLGAPLLPALALLGALRRPWRRPHASGRLFVMLIPATAVVATFSALWSDPRFYFVLVPFLLIWAANGLVEIGLWTKSSIAAARWRWLNTSVSQYIISGLIGLAVVTYPIKGVRELYAFTQGSPSSQVNKEVGLWIGQQQSRSVKIMDLSTPLAFHADAQYVHFPYCSAELALRFLDSAEIDYVVLRRGELAYGDGSPYYADWVAHGIPDSRAKLVYVSAGDEIVVFRWHLAEGHLPESPEPNTIGTEGPPNPESPTAGPLHVDPLNRRYFADKRGKIVLLAGSHTWGNLQDAGRLVVRPFNFDSYLDYVVANGHNFIRLWSWEQANWVPVRPYGWRIWPSAYRRTGPGTALDGGPRFNLEELNPDYFVRLRQRVKSARDRGVYVAIMLFNFGYSSEQKGLENPWRGHPFNRENNINGVDGDPGAHQDGRETHSVPDDRIIRFQEKYVAEVIDAVSDLDNVLYEISNESHPGSIAWQRQMVEFVRRYESEKGILHPVGITAEYPGGKNEDLFKSPADWIAPNSEGGYDRDPPAASGDKVIVADTDHIFGTGGDRVWVWKSLTRGLNILLMDPYDNAWAFPPVPEGQLPQWSELRRSIGYARIYLSRLDLATMIPHSELATTHYCLANPGSGLYLVYTPKREAIEVDTTASSGMLQVEWFEPATGKVIHATDVAGGKTIRLMAPYETDSVLLLQSFHAQQSMR